MSTDNHIIAQFTAVNTSLNNINANIQEANKELGEVRGMQKAQWGTIKKMEKQMSSLANHYQDCVAFERLALLEVDVAQLIGKGTPNTPTANKGIDWRGIFTVGNVRLFLLILFMLVLTGAVFVGVSVPPGIIAP